MILGLAQHASVSLVFPSDSDCTLHALVLNGGSYIYMKKLLNDPGEMRAQAALYTKPATDVTCSRCLQHGGAKESI